MEIVKSKPPNFEFISEHFPIVAYKKGILYCYNNTIYNPDGVDIPYELKVHEATHSLQQGSGQAVDDWWYKYCKDVEFRLESELEAHRAEYRATEKWDRNKRALYLHSILQRLSGPIYNHNISYLDAKRLFKNI